MKIVHLIDIPWWSGLTSYAFDCIEAHQREGHEVWLMPQKGSLAHRKGLEKKIKLHLVGGRGVWDAPSNLIKIGLWVLRNKPQLIVAHTGSTHWIGWVLGKLFKISLIRTRAISKPVKPGWVNQKMYQDCFKVIAASYKLKEECLERLSHNLKNISVLYPPSGFEHSQANMDVSEGFFKKQKIGILARLDPKKGYWSLLDAFEKIQKDFPDSELHIAGAEENLPWHELMRESKKRKLKNVVYHGFLSLEEVESFLKSCTLGVVASLGSEEVSRALIEWLSVGRPVVSTSVGCIPEILNNGSSGVLVAPGDIHQLTSKMNLFLKDSKLSYDTAKSNLEKSSKLFSIENFRKEWQNILLHV